MKKFYGTCTPEITERETKHMELVRAAAGECMVLLKNDGALPLKQKGGNLALFGNGGRRTIKGGTGSGDVYTRSVTNIEEGLEAAGYTITTKGWLNEYDEIVASARSVYWENVLKIAEERNSVPFAIEMSMPFKEPQIQKITNADVELADADTAIYVLARNSGEGCDRMDEAGDYQISEEELDAIKEMASRFEKSILVLNVGGVLNMKPLTEISGLNAILLAGQLGNIGGYAIADVLTGKQVPSGKLTDTWAENYADYPSSEGFSHNDGDTSDEYYTEGIYVGYRYFDTFQVTPVYCFGYGIGYTEFAIQTVDVKVEGNAAMVTAKVTNTGSEYSGKEVVQVYYSAPAGKLEKPYQELAAYAKTGMLAPGETEELEISFPITDMASYSEADAAWILEAGAYAIRVGNSSRNTKVEAILTIEKETKTEILKNLFRGMDEPVKEISAAGKASYSYESEEAEKASAKKLMVDLFAITCKKAVYEGERTEFTTTQTETLTLDDVRSGKASAEELVAQLSLEELADLCVGTMRMGGGSIVGDASITVPGAAGDTSSKLEADRKIRNLILADGPAGLRLQQHYRVSAEGTLLPGGEGFGGKNAEFGEAPEGSVDYYQYCTAIPIGWSLAQSWNTELLSDLGELVGKEMKEFNVDLWLAPALNIHRNPLCGRNFEYYSEDPLISGACASAITNGVQSDSTVGTTIKHFAANNQEDDRYFTNSHVSERALREIYLKGFEITVKESQPLSIMTSYNLINGVHAANDYDLLQAAARDEWGFQGVVMTDWFTSQDVSFITGESKKYGISASTGCIYAGNDLQMPGCQKNVDDIVEAVKTGTELDGYKVTLADVQACVLHLLKVILAADAE